MDNASIYVHTFSEARSAVLSTRFARSPQPNPLLVSEGTLDSRAHAQSQTLSQLYQWVSTSVDTGTMNKAEAQSLLTSLETLEAEAEAAVLWQDYEASSRLQGPGDTSVLSTSSANLEFESSFHTHLQCHSSVFSHTADELIQPTERFVPPYQGLTTDDTLETETETEPEPQREIDRFRFMDLPGEMRQEIYILTMARADPISVQTLELPAICCVPGKFQEESLPVFFDQSTFKMTIRAPLKMSYPGYQQGVFMAEDTSRYKEAGRLDVPQAIHTLFRTMPIGIARIRNLDVRITDLRGSQTYRAYGTVSLRLSPGAKPAQSVIQAYSWVWPLGQGARWVPEFRENMNYICNQATGFLQAVVSREDYEGLSVNDLKGLAKVVRVKPRPGSPVEAAPDARIETVEF